VASWFFLPFPRRVESLVAGPEEAKNQRERRSPPDSDPFSEADFEKISPARQAQSRSVRIANLSSQNVVISANNETFSVIAIRVGIQIVRPFESIAETQLQRHLI
jgi:hypothetical protein